MSRMLILVMAGFALVGACGGESETPPSNGTTATANPTSTAALTSGIEGQVLLGPTCPVEREGMPCETPYEATIVVWDGAKTKRVLVFNSDDDGRFRVGLPPGEYYLEPQGDQQGLPRPEPQTVSVPADTFVSVTLRYDTGIR